jgi:hypothetical protein
MSLFELATDALQNLRIEMEPIFPCRPPDWNVGELAVVQVRITNVTGYRLQNMDAETFLFTPLAEFVPVGGWDGNGAFRSSLEPNEVWETYVALLRGLSPGTFSLGVFVYAEVIPHGAAPGSLAEYSVLP